MKKKLLSVVLAGAMTVSLAGCGGGSTPTTAAPTTAAETKAEAAETKAEEKKEEAATEAPAAGADVSGLTVAFIPKLTGNAFFESANIPRSGALPLITRAAPMQRLLTRLT